MTNENLHNGQAAEPGTGNDAQALPDAAKPSWTTRAWIK